MSRGLLHARATARSYALLYSLTLSRSISTCCLTGDRGISLLSSQPDLLPLCSNPYSLPGTKRSHALAIVSGLLPRSVSLSAALILSYAANGHLQSSRILFQQTTLFCHTAFLWNTLVRAQSICGIHDGFQTYNSLVRSGIRPDDHTFPFVLKACADHLEVEKGMEVHGVVFKLGYDDDVYVGNTLMQFYGNCRDLRSAGHVFDEMPERDAISWNTAIGISSNNGLYHDAISLFGDMVSDTGLSPNLVSVISVLPVCAGLKDETVTKEIHAHMVKRGLGIPVTAGNALIDAYGKCGSMKASKQVFDEMIEKNEVSWNAIITSLAYWEFYTDALSCFCLMVSEGLTPNTVTISSMLPVLVGLRTFSLAKELHGYSIRMGMESDIFISNSLIDMYAKSGCPTKAASIFHQMNCRNLVSWNAMVANFAQNMFELQALDLIRQMQDHGETLNPVTFTNLLPACSRIGSLQFGKEIHARVIRMELVFDLFVSNALMDMYAKCGSLKYAESVFRTSLQKDEVSYNSLIIGFSRTSACMESLVLFREMWLMGMQHDVVSCMGVISACANLAALKQGKEIHGLIVRKLFQGHLFVANSLLDLYIKCGQIDIAKKVFDGILNKDVASWNIIILGYGMIGKVDIAISLFEAMKCDGVDYDSVSYIAILSACSHGGLFERGRKYFDEMLKQNIKPTAMHYACMVDLLGRAGLMGEAVKLVKDIPIEPDSNVWGALLGACRLHGNIEVGCWAADNLLKLKPEHCGYYVLLSNIYAEAGRWDDADRVRELMKCRKVKKDPGFSWVQICERVHAFVVGEKLEDLEKIYCSEGYG
ncbi:hypothetical protein SAY87_013661 [Trapa incisa]|uniref:Pentatricopeptide repeat-containing protein n=1 Tax=Trapa incisa TaxID=236973 RepID=A0AAN7QDL6_9MYRT|nr:hypothetical protein SAY87_013661 [Trapa incisa]